MTLRFIEIPEPVEIARSPKRDEKTREIVLDPSGVVVTVPLMYSFAEAVIYVVDNAPEFAVTQSAVRMGARIVAAVEQVTGRAELRQDDWKVLADVVEANKVGFGKWGREFADEKGNVRAEPIMVSPRKFLNFANAIALAAFEEPSAAEAAQ